MKKIIALILVLFGSVSIAQAKPPTIDYQWKSFEGNRETCLNWADTVFEKNNFTFSHSTNVTNEVVAYKGDYKAVIACFIDYGLVVFTVAGPDYKTAHVYAETLRNNF